MSVHEHHGVWRMRAPTATFGESEWEREGGRARERLHRRSPVAVELPSGLEQTQVSLYLQVKWDKPDGLAFHTEVPFNPGL